MRSLVLTLTSLLFASLCLTPGKAQSSGNTLDINPIYQETTEWCWVATGQMIFQYFQIPMINRIDGQCGIVSLWGAHAVPPPGQLSGPCLADCRACPFPAGQVDTIAAMLQQYPIMAGFFYHRRIAPLRFQTSQSALTQQQISDEIDASRPVLVGISPSGNSAFGPQHVALIVGYETDANDNLFLIVNDPFPFAYFAAQGISDPYIVAGGQNMDDGRYRISYRDFKNRMHWSVSIHHLRQGS